MTLYRELVSRGYMDKDLRDIANQDFGTRTFSLSLLDTPDNEPIVGIEYRCDYRSEEESGINNIRDNALGVLKGEEIMNPKNRSNVACFNGIPSLIISTQPLASSSYLWGHNINIAGGYVGTQGSKDNPEAHFYDLYDLHFMRALPYAQGLPHEYELDWTTIPKLKALAKSLGLRGLPTRKSEIVEYLQSSSEYTRQAKTPYIWPGWFHYGRILVLRADKGVTAEVISHLYRASQRGTLAIGNGTQEHGFGFTLYDGADVGPKLKNERHPVSLIEAVSEQLIHTA